MLHSHGQPLGDPGESVEEPGRACGVRAWAGCDPPAQPLRSEIHPSHCGEVITCVVDYTIRPEQTEAFERFAAEWIRLVNAHGGQHHGYFLPAEGASDKALALFTFPSLAPTRDTAPCSGSIRSSSRPTGSVTRAAAS